MNLKSIQFFRYIILIIIIGDLSIFFDTFILKQLFGLIFALFLPGYLLLELLRIDFKNGMKYVYIISFSILTSFCLGLFTNIIFYLIRFPEPLSQNTILITLNIYLILALSIIYLRIEKNHDNIINYDLKIPKLNQKQINNLLFPILFPLLAIIGTTIMNSYNNNMALIILLVIIILYIPFTITIDNNAKFDFYPYSIYMIASATLMMHGLTSSYIIGTDVIYEFKAFQEVVINNYWSLENFQSPLTACLSTSIFPSFIQMLTGIKDQYIYKLIFPLIFSFTPVVIYYISNLYFNRKIAFIAGIFFIAQLPFIFTLQSAMRQEIAFIFIAVLYYTLLKGDINSHKKRFLIVSMTIGIIFSHYTSVLILLLTISITLFTYVLINIIFKRIKVKCINENKLESTICSKEIFGLVLIIPIIYYLWYELITKTVFTQGINLIDKSIKSISWIFADFGSSNSQPLKIMAGSNYSAIAEKISVLSNDLSLLFIAIGGLVIIYLFITSKQNIDICYLLLIIASFSILGIAILLPGFNTIGLDRVYLLTLILLAPLYGLGAFYLIKKLIRNIPLKYIYLIISLLLILQFSTSTHLVEQLLNKPNSMDLNRDGDTYYRFFIHKEDYYGADWISDYTSNEEIFCDRDGWKSLSLAKIKEDRFKNGIIKKFENGYLFLRYTNTVHKVITASGSYLEYDIYENIIDSGNQIYSNNGSRIIFFN